MAVRQLQRRLATGANAAAVVALVLASLALAVELVAERSVRWDLTAGDANTLSDDTLAALERVEAADRTLRVTAFTVQARDRESATRNRLLRDFVVRLREASERVDAAVVDLDRDRLTAERLGVDRYGTVVLEAGGDRVDLLERELFRARGPRGEREVTFVGEAAIAAGVRQLLADRSRVVYWLGGHGERERYDRGVGELQALSRVLDQQGLVVRDLDLLRGGAAPAVPADGSLVVVAGPRHPLAPVEEEALRTWLGRGGALLVLLEPGGFVPGLIEEIGLTAPEGVVLDTEVYYPHGDRPRLRYGAHPIARELAGEGVATVLAWIAPLELTEREGVRASPLLQTGRTGWIERGDERPPVYDPDEDGAGPVVAAVAATVGAPHPWIRGGAARVVVVGDTDWVGDELLEESPGNATLAVATLRWLLRADERFAVVERPATVRRLALGPSQLEGIRWLLLGAVPLSVLALGGLVARLRRVR